MEGNLKRETCHLHKHGGGCHGHFRRRGICPAEFRLSGSQRWLWPGGAIIAGNEANGAYLFSCIALYNGGAHPGKVRDGFGGCHIGFNGAKITAFTYEVLIGSGTWTLVEIPGYIPPRAVPAGFEASDEPLYICNAPFNGGIHPGKTRPGFAGCNITYGDVEYTVNPCAVFEP